MPFDKEKYRPALAALRLGRDQEDTIIECIRAIMAEFVSAAFGKHPVQQAMNQRKRVDRIGNESAPMLGSPASAITQEFSSAQSGLHKYKGDYP